MTTTTLSTRAEVSSFSFVLDTLKGLRRRPMTAAQRKHLLGLDDYLLRDIGMDRFEIMRGRR